MDVLQLNNRMTSILISLFGLCNCWRQYLDSLKVHANFLLKQAWLTCQSRGPCICGVRLAMVVDHGILVRESTPLVPLRVVPPACTT